MIGKVVKPGKSFKGCIEYNLKKKTATILDANGIRVDKIEHVVRDFNMQRKMNPKLGQAVGHCILSWSVNDKPKLTDEVMKEIAAEYLEKMKIQNTQFLVVRHEDKEHPHLHIIYNRVANDGKTIPDNFQHLKSQKITKALTLKYGFYMAEDKKMVNRKQLKGADKIKYELFDAISNVSKQIKSMQELKSRLLQKGIQVQFKYKGGTQEIQGISFIKDGYQFKGSEIDRSLSYGKLCQKMDENVQEEILATERHKQFVSDLRNAIQQTSNETPAIQPFVGSLLNAGGVIPIPEIADDEDDAKRRKRRAQGLSR